MVKGILSSSLPRSRAETATISTADRWSQAASGIWLPKVQHPLKPHEQQSSLREKPSIDQSDPEDQPGPNDHDGWTRHWEEQGIWWRREPEISKARQEELEKRRQTPVDIQQGIFPFVGMILTRADLEWLLMTHERGHGPIDWSNEEERTRKGLDLRGARVSERTDLSGLPLANVLGGFTDDWFLSTVDVGIARPWLDMSRTNLSRANLEGANLCGAKLEEVNLRWANLEGADLSSANLAGTDFREARLEDIDLGSAMLESADLSFARLEGADLSFTNLKGAHFNGANLKRTDFNEADLEETHLERANLENADLNSANLKRADFNGANLKGADLRWANLEGADLRWARLDRSRLAGISLADADGVGPFLADAHWGDTSLVVVGWSQVHMLGDEFKARQHLSSNGKKKDHQTRQQEYQDAYRANHQLVIVLQEQGLIDEASQFAYRAKSLHRTALWHKLLQKGTKRRGQIAWSLLFSWTMFLLAGYGHRLRWCLLWFAGMVALFTLLYWWLDPVHMPWWVALGESVSVFHGRGIAPNMVELAHPVRFTILTIIEVLTSLVIGTVFVATILQRFLGK